MATLSALLCTNVGETRAIATEVATLAACGSLIVRDAAAVARPAGPGRPAFRQLAGLHGSTPMNEAFWHLLLGHILRLPTAAAGVDSVERPCSCSLAGLGIRDDFLHSARRRLTPGTSALFLLTDDATVDRLLALLPSREFTVTSTNLSARQLQGLVQIFAGPPAGSAAHTFRRTRCGSSI